MKSFLIVCISIFSFNSFANSSQCVDRVSAEKSLTQFIANDGSSIYNMSSEEYFYNYVADSSENQTDYTQWLADFQNQALQKLNWNTKTNQYETDVVWNYECAPSASCWGGYVVDCAGGTSSWFEGEE